MPRSSRRLHSATVSRLKALLSLTENFSRATLINAGATSAKWKNVVAGWTVAAGKGTSIAIGALISTTFSSTNATIKAKNPAGGVGPAFWVTDSGNYWSVIHNIVNVCQTCSACGSYNSCVYCSSYGEIAQSGCTQTGSCPASSCNGGYSSCPVEGCNGGYSSCPAQGCSNPGTCPVSGCAYYTTEARTSCNSPYFYSTTTCSQYAYYYKYGYACFAWTTTPQTGCGSYYTYYVNVCGGAYTYYISCCVSGAFTYYVTCCPGGTFLYYQTCCPGGFYNYTVSCCTGTTYTYYVYGCTGNSYGASASCGCASYYTYSCNCADNHKIDLYKKENGTETLVSSTSNSTSNIAGIQVITSGNSVTATAYSDTNFSSQVGSTLTTTNTGQKSKDHGIISKASTNSQGYTIDEFRVNE
jgi:hypothetical protein